MATQLAINLPALMLSMRPPINAQQSRLPSPPIRVAGVAIGTVPHVSLDAIVLIVGLRLSVAIRAGENRIIG